MIKIIYGEKGAGKTKQIVDNANEEIEALHRIDPRHTAVADRKFAESIDLQVLMKFPCSQK